MEIIKINDSRYDIYEELLIKRDTLKKEADISLTLYINRFGELITAVFQKKDRLYIPKKSDHIL